MNIDILNDFSNIFEEGGSLSLVYIINNEKNKCNGVVSSILEEQVKLSLQVPDSNLFVGQTISVIYNSIWGLFGFHAEIVAIDNTEILITKPEKGWKVQRRKHPRIMLNLESSIKLCKKTEKDIIVLEPDIPCLFFNISAGGVAIESNQDLDIGEYVETELDLDDKKIQEKSIVVWKGSIPEEKRNKGYKNIFGLRFINPAETTKEIVSELEKSFEEE